LPASTMILAACRWHRTAASRYASPAD
jgi:hypothetical protein